MIYCTHTDVTRTNNNIYDLQNSTVNMTTSK